MKSGELKKVLEYLGDDFELDLGIEPTLNFEDALKFLFSSKIKTDDEFAFLLWGSITNVDWYRKDSDIDESFSFRVAGAILAEIHGNIPESYGDMRYMYYYCSSDAGVVDEGIEDALNQLGWYVRKYE